MMVRIELLAAQRRSLWVGNLVCVAITAAVVWQQTHSTAVFWWCLAHAVVMFLRVTDARLFHSSKSKTVERQRRFLFTMCTFSCLNGIVWGAALLLFLDVSYPVNFIFLVITIACVTVGGMPALTMYFPAYLTFAIPIVAGLVVSLFLQDTYEGYLLSMLAIAFGGVVIAFARNLAEATTKSITMEREMALLLDAVSEAKDRVEEVSAGKSRFMAAISHDVSQPLYSTMLYLEALRNKGLPPDQSDLLDKLETSTTSLHEMFNSMVDVARLEQGEVDCHETNFAIAAILQNLEDELRPQTEAKALEFSLATDSDAVVLSDSVLLARVLRNLIHNAIKYTDAGFVRVELEQAQDTVVVRVRDSGRGIPEEEHALIFEEYQQVDNEERNYARGLGLGLSVVNKLVALLGHTLEMESKVGEGTTFTLTVQRGELHARDATPIHAGPSSDVSGLHIMVLEDDAHVRQGMETLLRDWGCVVTAHDNVEALIKVAQSESRPPDLLLSDFRLPGDYDGIAASARVRDELDPQLPCIVVSGDGHEAVVGRVRASGLQYLPKPVVPNELRLAIAQSV
ncbi:MAG: ATP-binding protein [Halioglobus sp.]